MSKSGFVAIIGRPSSGKSTLLNTLCGQKVSITSSVPQTTRNKIRGIVNEDRGQLVFLDTPGYHRSERKFNRYLRDLAESTLQESDVVLYVADLSRAPGVEEDDVLTLLQTTTLPRLCALNKIDLPQTHEQRYRELLHRKSPATSLFPISALTGTGTGPLLDALFSAAPQGEPFYDADYYTDQAPEFRIAEIVREKAIARTQEEVPHALYVEIADMEMREDSGGDDSRNESSLWVRAFLNVERESQKGILVGKQGRRIREIRLEAQRELNQIFPFRIHLDLRVKVQPKWRSRDPLLRRLLK
ncbi:MAG: GTPase Era [Spirochaetaceae bacterium]|nr:MAG: GTPase Era [Spirochaetaceae bacterium]